MRTTRRKLLGFLGWAVVILLARELVLDWIDLKLEQIERSER